MPRCPASLEQALDALERGHDFLRQGNLFTGDVVEIWIAYKRSAECGARRLRPHPYEFMLDYDA